MNYRGLLIGLVLVIVSFGCSTSDTEKKIKQETQDFVDSYKGDQTREIVDTENSSMPEDEDIKKAINLQNIAREEVGIPKNLMFTWSEAVANDAQSYARTLANSGRFEHDPKNHLAQNHNGYTNGPYGENIYAYWSSNGTKPTYEMAVQSWIDEKNNYHYAKIGDDDCDYGKQCGHYTQIVWKSTTKIGCGMSRYKKGEYKGGYIIVCKYKTPGNIIGEYPY
ncbi:MAG: hypothetical protein DSZ06_01300 [Sulfurospirillum sp.]|nr:MAG: hypothetical protein DSZ06_01300 [Sulfurospirillum sp.]